MDRFSVLAPLGAFLPLSDIGEGWGVGCPMSEADATSEASGVAARGWACDVVELDSDGAPCRTVRAFQGQEP